MELELDLRDSAPKNANDYFEKAKKLEEKVEKAREILKELEAKRETKEIEETIEVKPEKEETKQQWFEKYRWFRLPDGRLVVGGRDATTNEIIIKKHTEKNDVVFHTEIAGSPFFVIKTEGKEVSKEMLEAVAQATASYSKAWGKRLGIVETYWVTPDQVSKQAPSGEYMGKGAFMIRGKRNWMKPELRIAVAWDGKRVIGGPVAVIKPNSKKVMVFEPGYLKPSDIAKKAAKWFGAKDVDEVLKFLPAGKSDIVESKELK
jgi:predicted ribosome quality control (RQC) complex YloA/Tae2 family protein